MKTKTPKVKKIRILKYKFKYKYKECKNCVDSMNKFRDYTLQAQADNNDGIFIRHIQSHLKEGQEVVCKICGRKAKDIIKEVKLLLFKEKEKMFSEEEE